MTDDALLIAMDEAAKDLLAQATASDSVASDGQPVPTLTERVKVFAAVQDWVQFRHKPEAAKPGRPKKGSLPDVRATFSGTSLAGRGSGARARSNGTDDAESADA